MPQPFNDAVMTDSGAALLARAQAGETRITFTRISTGNGEYTEDEKTVDVLKESTGLRSLKNDYSISIISFVDDTTVRVVSLITNEDFNTGTVLVDEGYYINEVGLFAMDDNGDEVLYSIAVTAGEEGDYLPAFDGYNPAQITQEYYVVVNNSADVKLQISDSAVMLTEYYDPEGRGEQVAFESDVIAQIEEAIAQAQEAIDSAVAQLETMLTNGSVTKVGTSTVGGTARGIYLNSGTPTAMSSTVGSSSKPVYLSSGTVTAASSTIGSTTKPVYMNSGTITAFSSTVGGSTNPVYMNAGAITACSTTVGSGTRPIYSSSGTLTASSSSVGGTNQPVYMSSGTMTACNSMVPQSGGVSMTGTLSGPTGTDYTTLRFRNIRFGTSKPSSLNNGDIYMVYE